LRRVEKTAARLERRKLKLQALEMEISDLERHVAEVVKSAVDGRNGAMRQALLIFNPWSGKNDENNHATRLSQVVDHLLAHGIRAKVEIKTSGKVARALAKDAADSGASLVVVAAGDGTIEEVAAQLIGSSTVLGIVPMGTMNNLARSLGVPLDIADACALIGMGTTRRIDVGRVLSNTPTREKYFLECASVGLSALAAVAGQAVEKHHWRILPRALRKVLSAKLCPVKVEIDETVIEARTRMVTVLNSPLVGKHLLGAPGAKMDDGWLDVAVYDGMGDADLIRHFMAAANHPDDLKIYRGRRVRITCDEPMLTNTETKDATAIRVLEIEVVPKALSMIVGNGIALTIPVEAAPNAPAFADDPPHPEVSRPAKVVEPATALPAS
jgi:diacylglycerol kinase (ATP)